MADTIPMLRREQRRHLLMNGWLIAGFIVVGTAVTNERGIFRPIGLDNALSATARAFIAMASPAGLGSLGGPRLRDIRTVSSLAPFEVTAPSRDLRRRLIDSIDYEAGEGEQEPLAIDSTGAGGPVTVASVNPTEVGADTATPPAFQTPPTEMGITTQTLPPETDDAGEQTGVVPEPATWAMLILGFGIIGTLLRRADSRRRAAPSVRRRRGSRSANVTA